MGRYIVEEFAKNTGGGCSSSYFYKLPDSVSEKVFGGPIWDYDKAYGRAGGIAAVTNDLNYLTLYTDYTNLFICNSMRTLRTWFNMNGRKSFRHISRT